ncbi:hypothetical protein [Bdellovibrio sp. HCB209]|uniref:hypothetical protein n=1 Tax=Bdellovibrio sp. HCB209 TaxID=3394354 RepID=UPI0039B56088
MKILLLITFITIGTPMAMAESEWSFGADVSMSDQYFPEEYGEDTNNNLLKIEIDPLVRWKHGERWRFYLKPVLVADPDNKSSEEKFFADPTEAYIKFKKDVLTISAGYHVVTWGVTDGYNPVDFINRKQIYDPIRSKKLGAASIIVSESLKWFDYDFIYIPRATTSLMPGEESRWLPREVFIPQVPQNNLVLILPENLRYHWGTERTLDNALDNNFGLRLQKSFSIFDISISGYDGAAPYPIIEPQVTGTITQVSPKTVIEVDPDVYLNRKEHRIRQGGFTLVSRQWDFLFKYATSYTSDHGQYYNLPGWIHESVVGLEKTFNFSDAMLIGILQYSFLDTERKNDSNISITEIFRAAWMAGGRLTWKEVWNASFLGLYDTVHYSYYLQASLGRRFFDSWNVSLTADSIAGSSENPLGLYSKNDSYLLTISRSF